MGMNAAAQVRKYGKDAILWCERAALAESQGDAPAAAMARERAQFASIKAFRIAQVAA
jgi:hypothetical protein